MGDRSVCAPSHGKVHEGRRVRSRGLRNARDEPCVGFCGSCHCCVDEEIGYISSLAAEPMGCQSSSVARWLCCCAPCSAWVRGRACVARRTLGSTATIAYRAKTRVSTLDQLPRRCLPCHQLNHRVYLCTTDPLSALARAIHRACAERRWSFQQPRRLSATSGRRRQHVRATAQAHAP